MNSSLLSTYLYMASIILAKKSLVSCSIFSVRLLALRTQGAKSVQEQAWKLISVFAYVIMFTDKKLTILYTIL